MKKVIRIVRCIVKVLLFISWEKRRQKRQSGAQTVSGEEELDSESEEMMEDR